MKNQLILISTERKIIKKKRKYFFREKRENYTKTNLTTGLQLTNKRIFFFIFTQKKSLYNLKKKIEIEFFIRKMISSHLFCVCVVN